MNTKNKLTTRIETLRKAEGTVKEQLGHASREVLSYLLFDDNPHDIGMLNRLVDALTPMNKKAMCLFAVHFLPYKFDEEAMRFGKLNKKQLERCKGLVEEFLGNKEANLWTWAADNIKVEKPKDYQAEVMNAVKRSLKGNAKKGYKPISQREVISAVLDAGVNIDELIGMLADLDVVEVQEAA